MSTSSQKIDIGAIGGAERTRSNNINLKWTGDVLHGASPTSVADFALFEFGGASEDNHTDDVDVNEDELTQDEDENEEEEDVMSDSDVEAGTPTGRGGRGELTSPFPVLSFEYIKEEGEEDKYSGSVGSEDDCIMSSYDCSDTASITSECITSEWNNFSELDMPSMSLSSLSSVITNKSLALQDSVEPLPELSERSLADWVSHSLDAQM